MPKADKRYLNIRVLPELHARAEACARAEGLSLPEFARVALADRCQDTEKREGQRRRMTDRIAQESGQ